MRKSRKRVSRKRVSRKRVSRKRMSRRRKGYKIVGGKSTLPFSLGGAYYVPDIQVLISMTYKDLKQRNKDFQG